MTQGKKQSNKSRWELIIRARSRVRTGLEVSGRWLGDSSAIPREQSVFQDTWQSAISGDHGLEERESGNKILVNGSRLMIEDVSTYSFLQPNLFAACCSVIGAFEGRKPYDWSRIWH